MSKRIASIISYGLLLFMACGFFGATLSFPPAEADTGLYASPAYYPQMVCAGLCVFSLVGMYQDIFGAGKSETKRITIGNLRNYFLVIAMSVLSAFIWQYWELFYVASFLCMAVLLYVLSDAPAGGKKFAFSVTLAAGCTAFLYVSFVLVLNVQL